MYKTGIGQDSHCFENEGSTKPLMLGGVHIPDCPGLMGNSDADVVLHALTNAVSGVTGRNVLGKISDDLCFSRGIKDSRAYLAAAIGLMNKGDRIRHISVAIEGKRPRLERYIGPMKESLARLLSLSPADVGITATSGEGLTAFGKGEGLQAFAVVTAKVSWRRKARK